MYETRRGMIIMNKDVNRILNILGPVKELDLRELAWETYLDDCTVTAAVCPNYKVGYDNYIFTGLFERTLLFDRHDIATVLLEISNIVYCKHAFNGKPRYIEYNIKTDSAKLVNQEKENIMEKDECHYIPISHVVGYRNQFALDEIRKHERG